MAGSDQKTSEKDALSTVLRSVRLTGAVQFCFMPSGDWHIDARSARSAREVHFHIVVEGNCWVVLGDRRETLGPGDVIAFTRGAAHQLGVGRLGRLIRPMDDLAGKAAMGRIPVLEYGNGVGRARLMCGYLDCEALEFAPIGAAMPEFVLVRTDGTASSDWLATAIAQIVALVDQPVAGGGAMVERLTEMMFIELLRREMANAQGLDAGWMAAVADPVVGRALGEIHQSPAAEWSIDELARRAGSSRSVLSERFLKYLAVSPVRYIRNWRLHLATLDMAASPAPIAEIAFRAGYGSEASFNRAFKSQYGLPPVTWRARLAEGAAKG